MRCNSVFYILAFILSAGCKTKTVYVPVQQTRTETILFRDTVVNTQLVHYHDTATTVDSISFLSNPYAYSRAEMKGGTLRHSLAIWPDSLIPVKLHYIEKIRTDSIPVPYTIEKIVYTEKSLSGWDKFRLRFAETCLLSLLAGIAAFFFIKKI